jgi:hypothetical protein
LHALVLITDCEMSFLPLTISLSLLFLVCFHLCFFLWEQAEFKIEMK